MRGREDGGRWMRNSPGSVLAAVVALSMGGCGGTADTSPDSPSADECACGPGIIRGRVTEWEWGGSTLDLLGYRAVDASGEFEVEVEAGTYRVRAFGYDESGDGFGGLWCYSETLEIEICGTDVQVLLPLTDCSTDDR